jgi:hypothetical protein
MQIIRLRSCVDILYEFNNVLIHEFLHRGISRD